jgi:hypothetical protein
LEQFALKLPGFVPVKNIIYSSHQQEVMLLRSSTITSVKSDNEPAIVLDLNESSPSNGTPSSATLRKRGRWLKDDEEMMEVEDDEYVPSVVSISSTASSSSSSPVLNSAPTTVIDQTPITTDSSTTTTTAHTSAPVISPSTTTTTAKRNIGDVLEHPQPKKRGKKTKAVVPPSFLTEDCGICMDKFTVRGKLGSCEHIFCHACIKKWAKTSNTCPMCKKRFMDITPIDSSGKAKKKSKVKDKDQGDEGLGASFMIPWMHHFLNFEIQLHNLNYFDDDEDDYEDENLSRITIQHVVTPPRRTRRRTTRATAATTAGAIAGSAQNPLAID